MQKKPIGIFDSGLGGLTAISEIKKHMPFEDYIYFGDTARIPYGTRSLEVIRKYSMQDCRFLVSKGVKAILVACGTVSSNALELLKHSFSLPIIGVVDSAAVKAAELAESGNGIIAVLGTHATIKSGSFTAAIHKINPKLKVIPKSCPMFVPLVENGHTSVDDIAATAIARDYLSEIAEAEPAAVILGCTHYPLLSDIIESFLPGSVLISSGSEAVWALKEALTGKKMLNSDGTGRVTFFTSDDTALFAENAKRFLGNDISENIYKTDIEKY